MGNVSYDTLSIRIEADSKQANASISRLSANLENLDATAKKLDTARITEVKGLLQDIAKIDFSNVTKGLQSVVSAFKAFNSKSMGKAFDKVGANIQSNYPLPEQNFTLVGDSYTTEMISATKTLEETIADLNKQLPALQDNFRNAFGNAQDPLQVLLNKLRELLEASRAFSREQIDAIFRSIKTESSTFNTAQLEQLRAIMASLGISAEEADRVIKHLKQDIEKLEGGAKKGANGLKKLLNQFSKIMKYRIIRKIIQEIYKAITEGIKNVAQFDQATQDTLNRLSAKFNYLKNSIGAIFAPLIQIVAPILEMLLTLTSELNNEIAEFLASANGQTVFVKAKDDLEAYNNELKKTQALGIDELNVLQQDNAGSFEYADVDLSKGGQEGANALKDVIATLKDVFGEAVKYAKQFITEILPKIGALLKPILEVITYINELIFTLLGDTADGVNTSIEDFTDALSAILRIVKTLMTSLSPLAPLMTLIANVLNIINPIISIISGVIEYIFTLLEPIFTILGYIFDIVNSIISAFITWASSGLRVVITAVQSLVEAFKAVGKTIKAIFEGDFSSLGKIWEDLGNKLKKIWAGVGNSFVTVINGILTAVESFINWIVGGIANIAKYLGIDTSGWGVSFGRVPYIEYANGGFPEDGFFFANHNELVGQFSDGRTAVANNQQITAGIYQAVRDALRDAGGSGQDVVINLDGYELARVVTKKQNNFGGDYILGGNLNYGK